LEEQIGHIILVEENSLFLDPMINPGSHNDTIHPICFLEPHDHHIREVLFELMHLVKYLLSLLE
jgi:hypothetical protein